MGILKNIIFIASAIALTGCYTDFTPVVDDKPVLCLNALCTPGEPVEIEISRTWLYTDVESAVNHKVDDARVTVRANGQVVDENYCPEAGDRVTIDVVSERFGEASAEVTVPGPPEIKKISYQTDIRRIGMNRWKDEDGPTGDSIITEIQIDFDIVVRLEVEDRSTERQYYQLNAYQLYDGNMISDYFYNSNIFISPGRLNFEKESIFSEILGTIDGLNEASIGHFSYFTNRSFSPGSYTLNLNYDDFSLLFRDISLESDPDALVERLIGYADFEFVLDLSRVSESIYNRAYYLWQAEEGSLNDLASIGLADPMGAYSNVSTRAGVVGAKNSRVEKINLKEFITDTLRETIEDKLKE